MLYILYYIIPKNDSNGFFNINCFYYISCINCIILLKYMRKVCYYTTKPPALKPKQQKAWFWRALIKYSVLQ
jgi:hypothetical protein